MKKAKNSVKQKVFIQLESDDFWTNEVTHMNGYLKLGQFISRCSPNLKLLNKLNSISINILRSVGIQANLSIFYEFGEEL